MKKPIFLLIAAAIALSSCGGTQKTSGGAAADDGKSYGGSSKTETVSKAADAVDACKILPKETVEKITGETVSDAKLSLVDNDENKPAQFSLCTYNFGNDRAVKFFARRSEGYDNTPENIAETRRSNGAASDLKTEDAPELGAGAFWAFSPPNTMPPILDTLHAFKGENIYIYVMMKNPKSAAEGKAQAIQLAQAALPKL
jgi:hypothetical protein